MEGVQGRVYGRVFNGLLGVLLCLIKVRSVVGDVKLKNFIVLIRNINVFMNCKKK